jgi:hypothetical protein
MPFTSRLLVPFLAGLLLVQWVVGVRPGTGGAAGTIHPEALHVPPQSRALQAAVILFNFRNDTTRTFTPEQIEEQIFGESNSVASYYRDVSGGRLELSGDLFGWVTLPGSNENCRDNYRRWARAAQRAVQESGHSLAGYDTFIYLMPGPPMSSLPGCAGGWANPYHSSTWVVLYADLPTMGRMIAHELGHNLWLGHAVGYRCFDADGAPVAISQNCTSRRQDDPYGGIMSGNLYEMNNIQKHQAGFFDASHLLYVTRSGRYTLGHLESGRPGVRTIKILRDPDDEERTYYYLEYRRPLGRDTFGPADPVVNGISIRIGPDESTQDAYIPTLLVDTAPATESFLDAALLPGSSFADPESDLVIKTVSVSATSATVEVTLTR